MSEILESEGQAPGRWLLEFTAADPDSAAGDGRPWGDGTAMAARAAAGEPPWDTGNAVIPMISGFAALTAMRDAFENAIDEADALAAQGRPPGQRGHVYIADFEFAALRDISTDNPWGNGPWQPGMTASKDQTALGLVVRMMSAGIVVRLLLWMPPTSMYQAQANLADDHWAVAAAVQDHNANLQCRWELDQPVGVVALDLRTAAAPTAAAPSAALHQKTSVVRVGDVNVAFCGGVDIGFVRRDFGVGHGMPIGSGDWQSGSTCPPYGSGWPRQNPPPVGGYPAYPYAGSALLDGGRVARGMAANVFGAGNQYWHDHHLRLNGPIVATLEQQFAERWSMYCTGGADLFDRHASATGPGPVTLTGAAAVGTRDQVKLTSPAAISGRQAAPLPPAGRAKPAGAATVQMWRTIPLRPGISTGPFVRGEFTVMAGLAKAISQATELITIWDQCFSSEPLAKLLAARLMTCPRLRLFIVVPPYADAMGLMLRKNALQDLWHDLDSDGRSRVAVRDMWAQTPNVGVYVHAKSQTYDDQLLVCGSANLNRRSAECDAELDCAVLHPPTVRDHLANLYCCMTGQTWSDYDSGWLTRYWERLASRGYRALVEDPFFTETIGNPTTPNGVPLIYTSTECVLRFDPTSIGPDVEKNTCQSPDCPGDPKASGRLDEVTFLLERCHKGTDWPWRKPATGAPAADLQPGQPEAVQSPADR